MSKPDSDQIAALEKAIVKKYGRPAVQNPKANWTDEKEKEYLEQLKEIEKRITQIEETLEKVNLNGFFISKKLLNKENDPRTCPECGVYSFDKRDDIYMRKFETCFNCYVKNVDGDKKNER